MSEIRQRIADRHAERAAARLRADEKQAARTLNPRAQQVRQDAIRDAHLERLTHTEGDDT